MRSRVSVLSLSCSC